MGSFLNDIVKRVVSTGALVGWGRSTPPGIMELCEDVLSDKGEISGLISAVRILDAFEARDADGQRDFFEQISNRFGVDEDALSEAIENWQPGDEALARRIHEVSEPRTQELIRRINRAPGATARLVAMRERLIGFVRDNAQLAGLDRDFLHLFQSWFNRGFLELRQIDWNTPAATLEKIISYEAVHQITGWDDLRQRVADRDRRLFAFFHPAMPGDPLIFVEVALMADIPEAIGDIIASEREHIEPGKASVAVFYSISNCQAGLRGVSFGNFLIKQVVAELQRELPGLQTFVTLSPVPGLRRWFGEAAARKDPLVAGLDIAPDSTPSPDTARQITARYLTRAQRANGTAQDPVAHFHLGNGALLHAIHADADASAAGLERSWGVMVNYLYDSAQLEQNLQAYANEGRIAASAKVTSLAKK